MADEPPRPGSLGSATSPTSYWPIKEMSSAILPRLPIIRPNSQPSATHSSRCVCHVAPGSRSPSSRAMRWRTAAPCPFIWASVPTAPPSCSCSARLAASRRRKRLRTSGAAQPAHLKPKLVTEAGCISVRASIGVRACRSAWSSSAVAQVTRSVSISITTLRVTSAIAVSITSWLVLPKWTKGAASGLRAATASRRPFTNGMATLPASRLSLTRRGTSNRSTWQQLTMDCAAASGINPCAACARASAASTRSIAST